MFRPRPAVFTGALLIASLVAPLGAPSAGAAPPAAPARSYVVKDGDFLFGIAAKLKVKFADLLTANGLTATSVIHPGDTLKVPAATSATTSSAAGAGAASSKPAPTKAETVVAFALA